MPSWEAVNIEELTGMDSRRAKPLYQGHLPNRGIQSFLNTSSACGRLEPEVGGISTL